MLITIFYVIRQWITDAEDGPWAHVTRDAVEMCEFRIIFILLEI